MFSKILVPIDFSPLSRRALGHALLLAGAQTELELLHVVEPLRDPHPALWTGELSRLHELTDRAMSQAREALQAYQADLATKTKARVTTQTSSGPVVETIAERAAAAHADLVVMATHGRTGLAHVVLGSVCERLLRHSPSPVLVTRGGSEELPTVKRIVVAVDKSEHSARALELAARLGQHLGASVEVLYVWGAPFFGERAALDAELFRQVRQAATDELRAFVEARALPPGVTVTQTIVSGEPLPELARHLAQVGADLVVVGTHGRSGVKRWVLGSVAESVARYAPCAALVVP